MVQLPYLQPFTDVNKRTSRLGANIPLIKANLCPLSFIDIPQRAYIHSTLAVYEERRVEPLRDLFAWAYERSCEQYRVTRDALGQPDPIRFRYRPQLAEVVRDSVVELRPPQRASVRAWAEVHEVPAADFDAFTDSALGADWRPDGVRHIVPSAKRTLQSGAQCSGHRALGSQKTLGCTSPPGFRSHLTEKRDVERDCDRSPMEDRGSGGAPGGAGR